MFDTTGTVTKTNPTDGVGDDATAGTNLPVRPTEVR